MSFERLLEEFHKYGSDVVEVEMEKAPGDPPPPDPFARPTGQELFDSLSKAEQDALYGEEAANLIRNGDATLQDFIQHDGNFITRKPVDQVKAFREEDHPRDRRGRFGSGGGGETTQERATSVYHSLFNRIRESLGVPTASSPQMTFVPAGQGYTTSGVDKWGDVVSVQISPNAARQLASKDPKIRKQAEYAILHEFGRVFGPTEAYQAPDGNTGAGFANEFANQATRYLNGKITKQKFQQWARANVPQWGKDPATITVPAP